MQRHVTACNGWAGGSKVGRSVALQLGGWVAGGAWGAVGVCGCRAARTMDDAAGVEVVDGDGNLLENAARVLLRVRPFVHQPLKELKRGPRGRVRGRPKERGSARSTVAAENVSRRECACRAGARRAARDARSSVRGRSRLRVGGLEAVLHAEAWRLCYTRRLGGCATRGGLEAVLHAPRRRQPAP